MKVPVNKVFLIHDACKVDVSNKNATGQLYVEASADSARHVLSISVCTFLSLGGGARMGAGRAGLKPPYPKTPWKFEGGRRERKRKKKEMERKRETGGRRMEMSPTTSIRPCSSLSR